MVQGKEGNSGTYKAYPMITQSQMLPKKIYLGTYPVLCPNSRYNWATLTHLSMSNRATAIILDRIHFRKLASVVVAIFYFLIFVK